MTKSTERKNRQVTANDRPQGSENFLDWPLQKTLVDTLKIYGHGEVMRSSFRPADRSVNLRFKSALELVVTPRDYSINGVQVGNSDFDRLLNQDGRNSDYSGVSLSDPLMEVRKTLWRCQTCGRLDDNGYICCHPPDGMDLRLVETACGKARAAASDSVEESQ